MVLLTSLKHAGKSSTEEGRCGRWSLEDGMSNQRKYEMTISENDLASEIILERPRGPFR